jgi:hypothetical protein
MTRHLTANECEILNGFKEQYTQLFDVYAAAIEPIIALPDDLKSLFIPAQHNAETHMLFDSALLCVYARRLFKKLARHMALKRAVADPDHCVEQIMTSTPVASFVHQLTFVNQSIRAIDYAITNKTAYSTSGGVPPLDLERLQRICYALKLDPEHVQRVYADLASTQMPMFDYLAFCQMLERNVSLSFSANCKRQLLQFQHQIIDSIFLPSRVKALLETAFHDNQ